MKLSENQQKMLRTLPGVDHVLELAGTAPFFENIPKTVMVNSIRETLETLRNSILTAKRSIREESLSEDKIIELVKAVAEKAMTLNLKNLVRISQSLPAVIPISSMTLTPAGGAPDTTI